MKYALHFIGQAFHPNGILTTTSFHRAGGAGIDCQDINDKGINLTAAVCSPNCDSSNLRFLTKTDDGPYDYSSPNETRYKRKVRIERISNEHLRLTIKVYWITKKGYKEFKLMQEMYKWW